MIHSDNGVTSYRRGDLEEALSHMMKALEIFKEEQAMDNAFRVLMELERFEEAQHVAREEVVLFGTPDAFTNLGYSYEMQEKLHEAYLCYKRALEIDPTYELALRGVEEVRHKYMLQLPNVASVEIGGGDAEDDVEKITAAIESMFNKQVQDEP
jgi:tetratricopeptide (TPR) repeat protein